MRTIASHSLLVVVCLGCGALSLGFGSCGAASAGGPGEAPDSGVVTDGAARDVVPHEDSGSGIDAGSHDSGALDTGIALDSAPDEAGYCGEPATGLGATCDGCIQTNCEPAWCQCAAGEPDPDAGDAGSGCLQYVQCVEDCVQDDGGSPTDCLTSPSLCAAAPFTNPQQQAGHAFLDCLVQYCGSSCGQ